MPNNVRLRKALPHPILLNMEWPCFASHLHGERATALQGLNGCQHPGARPNVSADARRMGNVKASHKLDLLMRLYRPRWTSKDCCAVLSAHDGSI